MQKILTATALAFGLGLTGSALAQDLDAGKKVFRKCTSCHNIGEDAKNSTGPVLNNVLGRPAGSFEGYRYSKTLKAANAAGLVWDAEKLADYIADPKAFMKAYLDDPKARPKMTFKLKNKKQRADVIAYLDQFSAPVAAAQMDEGTESASAKMAQDDHNVSTEATVCVQNSSSERHLFAAEVNGGARVTGMLEAGETLCTEEAAPGQSGIVSVYKSPDHAEGCSRLVAVGTVEKLLKYADFDRCAWSSNS